MSAKTAKKTRGSKPLMAVAPASTCSRRLLAALLNPTIEMMQKAGISRMSCSHDKSFVLQMETGEVITIDQPK